MGDYTGNLPPGFLFSPTDEEIIVHFLYRKASHLPCNPDIIPDLDLYPYDPWELDGKALKGEHHWYFFSRRTQNRVSASGYWKQLDMEESIFNSDSKKIGMKEYLVYYMNESPMGVKTNWIMEEYRLSDSGSSSRSSKKRGNPKKDSSKFVLCRVYERNGSNQGSSSEEADDETELSCLDEVFLSLDDLDEISLPN